MAALGIEASNISIHAPAKGATSCTVSCKPPRTFQSTLPRRERRIAVCISLQSVQFQSTLPRRERRTLPLTTSIFRIKFQSTLPRRERPPCCMSPTFQRSISIHAPAKGATCGDLARTMAVVISIHAPAKGATLSSSRTNRRTAFQSTLPRRERRAMSTNAATCATIFQSTLPRRERPPRPGA